MDLWGLGDGTEGVGVGGGVGRQKEPLFDSLSESARRTNLV